MLRLTSFGSLRAQSIGSLRHGSVLRSGPASVRLRRGGCRREYSDNAPSQETAAAVAEEVPVSPADSSPQVAASMIASSPPVLPADAPSQETAATTAPGTPLSPADARPSNSQTKKASKKRKKAGQRKGGESPPVQLHKPQPDLLRQVLEQIQALGRGQDALAKKLLLVGGAEKTGISDTQASKSAASEARAHFRGLEEALKGTGSKATSGKKQRKGKGGNEALQPGIMIEKTIETTVEILKKVLAASQIEPGDLRKNKTKRRNSGGQEDEAETHDGASAAPKTKSAAVVTPKAAPSTKPDSALSSAQPRKGSLRKSPKAGTKKADKEAMPETRAKKRSGKASQEPPVVEILDAHTLELSPVETEDAPTPPRLAYGLDRVLFNPGVYQLQDPRSKVYNFDPYLAKIMPVSEFDYSRLRDYVTSSKDETLLRLAKDLGKKYSGSTSSMSSLLCHFHFLLSAWRPISVTNLSRGLDAEWTSFTKISRAPAATFLHWKDGVYAIDADKEFDTANVLSMLGKSMEKLLTLPKGEFETYRRSNAAQGPEYKKDEEESYHFTTFSDFLLRSQLDAADNRLPGTGAFDLKTRAVVAVRLDSSEHRTDGTDYEIRDRFGTWESFEREYYDMIRAAFLKYSLQVRMGRMDGIFVAFHNTKRIFGFQYVSLEEMDAALHGTSNRLLGDTEFKMSLKLLNELLDRATARFPGKTLRLFVETRPGVQNFMYFFAQPVTEETVSAIQDKNKAQVEKFERNIIGAIETAEVETQAEAGEALVEKAADGIAPEPDASGNPVEDVEAAENEGSDGAFNEVDVPAAAEAEAEESVAIWQDMQNKVEEAIEDDELGLGHVRDAIEDALAESGLLQGMSPEEAREDVNQLFEALTGETADQTEETPREEDDVEMSEPAGSTEPTNTEEPVEHLQSAGKSNSMEAGADTEEDVSGVQSGQSEDSSPLGAALKMVIRRVAERGPSEHFGDDAAARTDRKLRTFQKLLSELVADSRQAAEGSRTDGAVAHEDEGISGRTRAAPAGREESVVTSSDGDAEAKVANATEDAETEQAATTEPTADTTKSAKKTAKARPDYDGEVLGLVLTLRNRQDGRPVERPTLAAASSPDDPGAGAGSKLKWQVEYSVTELQAPRARSLLAASQARRRNELTREKGRTDTYIQDYLRMLSARGQKWRIKQESDGRGRRVHVVGEGETSEGRSWEEVFGGREAPAVGEEAIDQAAGSAGEAETKEE